MGREIKSIYITGARGFIGSHILRELQAKGNQCVALDRTTCELTDRRAVDAFFAGKTPGTVVHVAAKMPGFSDDSIENMFRQNVLATENLLASTTGYFVFVSSIDV